MAYSQKITMEGVRRLVQYDPHRVTKAGPWPPSNKMAYAINVSFCLSVTDPQHRHMAPFAGVDEYQTRYCLSYAKICANKLPSLDPTEPPRVGNCLSLGMEIFGVSVSDSRLALRQDFQDTLIERA